MGKPVLVGKGLGSLAELKKRMMAGQEASEQQGEQPPRPEAVEAVTPEKVGADVIDIGETRRQEMSRLAAENLGPEYAAAQRPIEEATEHAEVKLEAAEASADTKIKKELTLEQRIAAVQAKIDRLAIKNKSLDAESRLFQKNQKKIESLQEEINALQRGEATEETAGTEMTEAEPTKPDTIPPPSGVRETLKTQQKAAETEEEGQGPKDVREALGERDYLDLRVQETRTQSGRRFAPTRQGGGFVVKPEKRTVASVGPSEERLAALEAERAARTSEKAKEQATEDFLESEEFGKLVESGTAAAEARQIEKLSPALQRKYEETVERIAKIDQMMVAKKGRPDVVTALQQERRGLEDLRQRMLRPGYEDIGLAARLEQEKEAPEITTGEAPELSPEAKAVTVEEPEKAEAEAEVGETEMTPDMVEALLGEEGFAKGVALLVKHLEDPAIGEKGRAILERLQNAVSQIGDWESIIDSLERAPVSPSLKSAKEHRVAGLRAKADALKAELPQLYQAFGTLVDKAQELEKQAQTKAQAKTVEPAPAKAAEPVPVAKAEAKPIAKTVIEPAKPEAKVAARPEAKASAPAVEQPDWLMGTQEQMAERQASVSREVLQMQEKERELKRSILAMEQLKEKNLNKAKEIKGKTGIAATLSEGEMGILRQAENFPAAPQAPVFHERVEPSGLELAEELPIRNDKTALEKTLKDFGKLGPQEWGEVYLGIEPFISHEQWKRLDDVEKIIYHDSIKGQLESELKILQLQDELKAQEQKIHEEQTRFEAAGKPAEKPKAQVEAAPTTPTGTVIMSAAEVAAAAAASAEAGKQAEQAPVAPAKPETISETEEEHDFFVTGMQPGKAQEVAALDKRIAEVRKELLEEHDRIDAGLSKFASPNRLRLEALMSSLLRQKDELMGIHFVEPQVKEPEAPPGAVKRAAKWATAKGARGLGGMMTYAVAKVPGVTKFVLWDAAIHLLEGMVKWSDPGPALKQSIDDFKKWGKEKPKKET